MSDLFKPDIEQAIPGVFSNPDVCQRDICDIVQILPSQARGGCNETLCTGCILSENHIAEFDQWFKRTESHNQQELSI